MSRQTVLITGCSSGFGKLAAHTVHERGWNVVATMRSPERETELTELDDVLVLRLDVIDQASIDAALAAAEERFGGIDALVNNAGYGGRGLFEQATAETIEGMYATNVFGLMNVTRAVLPQMRARGEGVVVNVTSVGGFVGVPLNSIYISTKHAVEGLTESMALEYAPLNIRIRSVAPGAYPTRFGDNVENDLDEGDDELTAHGKRLRAHIEALTEQMLNAGGTMADPQEVAEKIWACVTEDTPVRNPVGADAEMFLEWMSQGTRQDFLDRLAAMLVPQD
jgi:NAD(P)-dependent dehydrogenase (short-subunit alcohol dehydrogenase family)